MVLPNVKLEEMVRGKIPAAFRAAIGMLLGVVNLKLFKGGKCQSFGVGWKRAFHHGRSAAQWVVGGVQVFGRVDRDINGGRR